MNCPRCGEIMYGSVCPRCGNVVLNDRESRMSARNSQVGSSQRTTNNRLPRRNDDVKFMDNNSGKSIKTPKKKTSLNINIFKLAVVVLAVLCAILFFQYRSASSQLAEAQNTINTQNESIKAKDQEINDLKAAQTKANEEASSEDNNDGNADDSAPTVEFDENGNVVNIDENSSSDSSSDGESEEKTEYKSGDTYTVKDGDTGSSICNKIYGKFSEELWEKILSANGMTNSTSFHPGDELKVP